MKQLSNSSKYIATLLFGYLASSIAYAQDSISTVVDDFEVNAAVIDNGPFYAQLWFWVVLGVVFLLILIVLLRGGGKKKTEPKVEAKSKDKRQSQEVKADEDDAQKESLEEQTKKTQED